MLLARSHHGARESIEAAREAQKAIALEPDLLEAVVSEEGQNAICQEQMEKARAAVDAVMARQE